ncbi:MAG: hypothetical protein WC712_14485 [Candidatus Brocadiia bacterium]
MKRYLLGYIVVLSVVVVLAIVYLLQRNVILRQGYEIAQLRGQIEDQHLAMQQMNGEISAYLRPERIMKVVGPKSAQYIRPSSDNPNTPGISGEVIRVARK